MRTWETREHVLFLNHYLAGRGETAALSGPKLHVLCDLAKRVPLGAVCLHERQLAFRSPHVHLACRLKIGRISTRRLQHRRARCGNGAKKRSHAVGSIGSSSSMSIENLHKRARV